MELVMALGYKRTEEYRAAVLFLRFGEAGE